MTAKADDMTRTLPCFGDRDRQGAPLVQRPDGPCRREDAAARWPRVVGTGRLAAMVRDGAARSQALPPPHAWLSAARGVGFLDAGQVAAASLVKGLHPGPVRHAAPGAAVARAVGNRAGSLIGGPAGGWTGA